MKFLFLTLIWHQAVALGRLKRASIVSSILSDIIQPDNYDVTLTFNELSTDYDLLFIQTEKTFSFQGVVEITLNILQPTTTIRMYASNIYIANYSLRAQSSSSANLATQYQMYSDTHELIFYTDGYLSVGTHVLNINYTGLIRNFAQGLFWRTYKPATGHTKIYYASENEPFGARKIFPSFDEPRFKATFNLQVKIPSGYTVYHNTAVRHINYGVPFNTFNFYTTPKMSTYLFAIFFAKDNDFACRKHSARSRLETCVQADRVNNNVLTLNEKSEEILTFYDNMLGIPYTMQKLQQFLLPGYYGGMENWGLIFQNEDIWTASSVNNVNDYFASLTKISHELAHQWFGNLVTMRWWDDVWLNEGFATFWQSLILKSLGPDWAQRIENAAQQTMQQAMQFDANNQYPPLVIKVSTDLDYGQSGWPWHVYNKGAAVLRMLNKVFGDEAFIEACKRYLKKYLYSTASTRDLWSVFNDVAFQYNVKGPADRTLYVPAFLENWTYKSGYPRVDVSTRCDTSICYLSFSQRRDLNPWASFTPADASTVYQIPLFVTFPNRTQYTVWLTQQQENDLLQVQRTDLSSIQFNANFHGYYVVSFTPQPAGK